jgi:hypothetical protein
MSAAERQKEIDRSQNEAVPDPSAPPPIRLAFQFQDNGFP